MKTNKIMSLGLMASVLMFSGAAIATEPTANDSTTVTGQNQLTTKNYVDSGLRAVNAKTKTNALNISANTQNIATNTANIGDLSGLNIEIADPTVDGGYRDATDLVEAINAVTSIANTAAAKEYTAGAGIDITNGTVSIEGASDTVTDKMYVYKNGGLVEMPVVNDWNDSALD